MTVHELIEKLQDCDKPDAEVLANLDVTPLVGIVNPMLREVSLDVVGVSFNESQGPVWVEVKL
jgi:hypothetical protein